MRKWTAVLAAGLLLVGWLTLLPSPAGAELKTSASGSIRFNAIWADANWGHGQDITWTSTPITNCSGRLASGGQRNCNVNDDSQFALDARRTRLQIDATDTAAGVKMAGRVQFDFDVDGASNARNSSSREPRFRLGYMQADLPMGLTIRVGQVRTFLSDISDNIIGGVGYIGTVQDHDSHTLLDSRAPGAQLMWTTKMMGGDLSIGVAAERNSVSTAAAADVAGTTAVAEQQAEGQKIPLFAVAARYRSPLVGLLIRYGGTTNRVTLTPNGAEREKTAWLTAASAEVTPIPPLTLKAQYWITEGLHRLNSGAGFDDLLILDNGSGASDRLEAWQPTVQSAAAGIEYRLTKDLTLLAAYMWEQADVNKRFAAGVGTPLAATAAAVAASAVNKTFQAWQVGVVYFFWTRWDTGLEFQHWERDTFGQVSGDINFVFYRLRFYF